MIIEDEEALYIDRSSRPNPYDKVSLIPILDSLCYPPQQTIFRVSNDETEKLPPIKRLLLSVLTDPSSHGWEGDVFDIQQYSYLAVSLLFTMSGGEPPQIHEFPWNPQHENGSKTRMYLNNKIVEHAEGIRRTMIENPWYYYSSRFGVQTFSQPLAPFKEAQKDKSTLRGLVTICFDPQAPTEDEATNFLLQYGPNIQIDTILTSTISHLRTKHPHQTPRRMTYVRR